MKTTIITLAFASVACFSLQAANHDHAQLSTKHMAESDLSIGYIAYDIDGTTLNGAQISHSKQYDSGFYMRGGFEYATKSVMGGTVKFQDIVATTGKQFTINDASLVYVEGAIHFMKTSYGSNSANNTEVEVAAGFKRALTHNLAATIGARYMDSEVSGEVGMRYSFTEMFAVSANYKKGKDVSKTGINLNVYF